MPPRLNKRQQRELDEINELAGSSKVAEDSSDDSEELVALGAKSTGGAFSAVSSAHSSFRDSQLKPSIVVC